MTSRLVDPKGRERAVRRVLSQNLVVCDLATVLVEFLYLVQSDGM